MRYWLLLSAAVISALFALFGVSARAETVRLPLGVRQVNGAPRLMVADLAGRWNAG
jgi:hypothetical protein